MFAEYSQAWANYRKYPETYVAVEGGTAQEQRDADCSKVLGLNVPV